MQERIFKNGQNTPCNVSFSSISLKWRKKYTCQIFVKTASVYANLATIRWKGKHHFFTQNQWVDNRCEKYGRNSERTITSRKDIVLTSIQLPCAMAGAKTNREDVSVQRNSHNEILCLPMAKKIEQHSTSFLDPPQITWDPPPNYEASKAFLKECFRHSAPEPKPSPPGRDRRGVSLIRGPGGTITTGLNTNNLAPRDEPPIHPHKLHPNRPKPPETFFRPGVWVGQNFPYWFPQGGGPAGPPPTLSQIPNPSSETMSRTTHPHGTYSKLKGGLLPVAGDFSRPLAYGLETPTSQVVWYRHFGVRSSAMNIIPEIKNCRKNMLAMLWLNHDGHK